MSRTTGTTKRGPIAATRARRSRRGGRLAQAAAVVAVLLAVGGRAMAAPAGPIDVAGHESTGAPGAARLGFGIDGQGRVDRVTVHRPVGSPDRTVTLVLADGDGRALVNVAAPLRGTDTVVVLPDPVDPALVDHAGLHPAP
jgi:hypothetical protein